MQTKAIIFCLYSILLLGFNSWCVEPDSEIDSLSSDKACNIEYEISEKYCSLMDTAIHFEVFEKAYLGYLNLLKLDKIKRKDTLTIVDFSQSSMNERLFIIDLKTDSIIHKSLVSHGIYSGRLIPKKFSNEDGSGKSSLGFYTIENTYKGKFDLALKLNGHEYSNSHARRRGIVMHAAEYANPDFASKNGALGRSLGCPALPEDGFEEVVDLVKGGSCLFIFAPNRSYLKRSKLLNRQYYLK